MSGEPIDEGALMQLFEAARWAPSSGNVQPWRMLYARRDTMTRPVRPGAAGPPYAPGEVVLPASR